MHFKKSKKKLVLLVSVGAAVIWQASAMAATTYTVTDLGVLMAGPYQTYSQAHGINELGDVVGYSPSNAGGGAAYDKAFLWSGGSITDLDPGGYAGYTKMSHAFAINNAGVAVGAQMGGGTWAAKFEGGSAVRLGTLGGAQSQANDINDSGQIVGWAETSGRRTQAVLWQSGTTTDLGVLDTRDGFQFSTANAINASGLVVGRSKDHGTLRGVRWDEGVISVIDLGATPGAEQSDAVDINDRGQILLNLRSGASYISVLWDQGNVVDLGGLSLFSKTTGNYARAVNNSGQVVGSSFVSSRDAHAYIWEDTLTGMVDLNSLIDPLSGTGWSLLEATDINDAGQIVGTGLYGGLTRAFLLTPVPEPESWAMLLVGLGVIGGIRRRRAAGA